MPKGVRRAAQFKHYKPRRWQPEFDLIVLASIAGKSNKEIATEFGYTPQHVSNILNTEHAEKVRDKVRENINSISEQRLESRISSIGNTVIERIETFVNDETMYFRNPFAFVDRATKLAQATGVLKSDAGSGTVNINKALIVTPDIANQISDGLRKSSVLDDLDRIEPGSN